VIADLHTSFFPVAQSKQTYFQKTFMNVVYKEKCMRFEGNNGCLPFILFIWETSTCSEKQIHV